MEKKYPIGGYAPGNYHNRCSTCLRSFFGDKRAVQCEPCAVKSVAEFTARFHDQIIANQVAGMPLEEAVFQAGYSAGVDFERGRKATPADSEALTIADYEEVLADHRRLVRDIDVLLNGDNAAKQASLCDLVRQIKELKQWKSSVIILLNKIDAYACAHADIKLGTSKVDFVIERARMYDAGQTSAVWVNLADNFTEDWELMHCRFAHDKYKLDTDLFELKDGGLVKKGGTGRIGFQEVEYLVESGTAEAGREENAVGFTVWCTDNYYPEHGYWWCRTSDDKYTIDQLYELFKKQNRNNGR